MELPPGTMFSGYRIVALLGQSPTGPVFLVDNPENGDREELHIVATAKGADLDIRGRLVDDASAVATSSNPLLVELRRGVQDGTPWFTIPDTGAAIPAQQLPPAPQPPASAEATVHVPIPPGIGKAPADQGRPAQHTPQQQHASQQQPPPRQPAPQGPPPHGGQPPRRPQGPPPGPRPGGPLPPGGAQADPARPGPRRGPDTGSHRAVTPPPPDDGPRRDAGGTDSGEPVATGAPVKSHRGAILIGLSVLAVVALVVVLILVFTGSGDDSDGGTTAARQPSHAADAPPGQQRVATNGDTVCAIIDGRLRCGRATSGDQPATPQPRVPQSLRDAEVTAVSVGAATSGDVVEQICAVAGGAVHCWSGVNPATTYLADDVPPVTAVSTDSDTTCAVAGTEVYCRGGNGDGQAGDRSRDRLDQATRVEGVENATGISVGGGSACATTSDGKLYCWGKAGGENGEVAEVSGLGDVTTVAQQGGEFCAIAGGEIRCWDERSPGDRATVSGFPEAVTAIAVGDEFAWALADGTLHRWTTPGGDPADVAELSGVTAVAAGPAAVCAVAADGPGAPEEDTESGDSDSDEPGSGDTGNDDVDDVRGVYCWPAGEAPGAPLSLP